LPDFLQQFVLLQQTKAAIKHTINTGTTTNIVNIPYTNEGVILVEVFLRKKVVVLL
jgi:hypothetical protein